MISENPIKEDMDTSEDFFSTHNEHEIIPEISFHTMTDTSHPQTIRLMEKLKNRDITVLVNGRSTHNFIDQTVVSKLGLPLVCDTTFQVMMANKEKIDCSGKCLSLTLFIQDQPITADFYVLSVAAC
ncbi:hypothetical protein ACOSQ4_023729 [Xanthoceras sorbifolium]